MSTYSYLYILVTVKRAKFRKIVKTRIRGGSGVKWNFFLLFITCVITCTFSFILIITKVRRR